MRKICLFAALFVLLIPLPSLLYAEDTDTAVIEQLIHKYGVRPLVSTILAARKSAITIDVNGELRPMVGLPDDQFVSARSILADLRIAGLTVASFAARIPEAAAAEKAAAERVAAARGRVAVRREVLVPSAEAVEEETNKGNEDKQQQMEEAREKHVAEQEQADARQEEAEAELQDLMLELRAYEQSIIAQQASGAFRMSSTSDGDAIIGGVVLALLFGWGIYRNYKLHRAWHDSFYSEEGNAFWRFCCRRGWHKHGEMCKQGDLAVAKAKQQG